MVFPAQIEPVLTHYGNDCRPSQIEAVGPGAGFSGALIWRLTTARGPLALRRWPPEHPDPPRLKFIHEVLWHVEAQGFDLVPAPIRTRQGAGFVESAGQLWELAPWMPGEADYFPLRLPDKLTAALQALARFHLATASFATSRAVVAPAQSNSARSISPGIAQRLEQLETLRRGGLQRILAAVDRARIYEGFGFSVWTELAALVPHIAALFATIAPAVGRCLAITRWLTVPLQPCIRDIWSEHVLFQGSQVSGLIDFGAMRFESVAGDVARLLGSLAGDNPQTWRLGLAAYQAVRPLSADESALVTAFDQSTTLLAAWNWLQWVFVDRRTFADPAIVAARVKQIVTRLEVLTSK